MPRRSFGTLVTELRHTLDAFADADLDDMVEPEMADALVDLLRGGTQLDAVVARVAARVDASKIWTNDGSRSCAAWLGRAAHRDRVECAAVVRRGRALRTMPVVDAAFDHGRLSARHVDLLAKAASKVPDHFSDDEAWLVARAEEMPFDHFAQVAAHWIHCASPDDAEEDALDRYRKRRLHLSPGLDGTGLLDVEFEPLWFQTFTESLRRIEHELWQEDWAEARRRLGEQATEADLRRSNAQRSYDALIEMARRAHAAPPGARVARPLITVMVGVDSLRRACELSNGTAVTPGEVARLVTEADVERAVFDAPRRVIELGRRSRLFVGGARRAVEIEHRTCTHPTCRVPAEHCDIDHRVAWEDGGSTNPDNGQPRCPQHHSGRHRKRPRRAGPSDEPG